MFKFTDEQLESMSAFHTVREIESQPRLWQDSFNIYMEHKEALDSFLADLRSRYGKLRVIFTGAGTSAYVGNTLLPYLLQFDGDGYSFEAIATTDIVSNPRQFLLNVPTLLVSFARSGNSPESVQAVKLADRLIDNIHHLAITCVAEGQLAINLKDTEGNFVLLMPPESNDKAFAMTSSFSCMLLSAMLIFDKKHNDKEKEDIVNRISQLAEDVIAREDEIADLINLEFNRIVYLGSGCLAALTREAQLKVLELTAGKIATCYDSSMGFRHGPKSFIDEKTIVFDFVSADAYTRQYDLDVVNEIYQDKIVGRVLAVSSEKLNYGFPQFALTDAEDLADNFLVFPYIVFAQIVSVLSSLKVNNKPDTPSASGTVNRVVKGVIIHELA